MRQLQHGDVLFQEITGLPRGVEKIERDNGRLVVMQGEATGHHHVITAEPAILWELKGDLYLEATSPVTITHEEHKPMNIPTGVYRIGRVREYDYTQDMERVVRD